LATPGDGLSGPDVVGVDPAEAIDSAEAQDPSAGPPGSQVVEVPSHPRVEQSDSVNTTQTHTLEKHTLTLDRQTLTHVILIQLFFVNTAVNIRLSISRLVKCKQCMWTG